MTSDSVSCCPLALLRSSFPRASFRPTQFENPRPTKCLFHSGAHTASSRRGSEHPTVDRPLTAGSIHCSPATSVDLFRSSRVEDAYRNELRSDRSNDPWQFAVRVLLTLSRCKTCRSSLSILTVHILDIRDGIAVGSPSSTRLRSDRGQRPNRQAAFPRAHRR
jgi:hypothetical protein